MVLCIFHEMRIKDSKMILRRAHASVRIVIFSVLLVSTVSFSTEFSAFLDRSNMMKLKSSKLKMFSGGDNNKESSSNDMTSNESDTRKGTLNPLRLAVLKLGMTEPRFVSPLNYEKRDGLYKCAGCGAVLFDSSGKYNSGSGWPSFWKSSGNDKVKLTREWDGRVECSCARCDGHLGHIFLDGPKSSDMQGIMTIDDVMPELRRPGGQIPARLPRFCINGASLIFNEREE